MTKAQLMEAVAAKHAKLKKKDIEAIVDLLFDTIVDTLATRGRVEIRGFGSWSVRERDARQGRNPKTGERVQVPKKKVPFFTAGKELKERVDARR